MILTTFGTPMLIYLYIIYNYAVWLHCVAAVFWMHAFDGKNCKEGREIMQKRLFHDEFYSKEGFWIRI